MAEIDRRAQEEYSIPGQLLMENAGLKTYLRLRERLWGGGLPGGPVVFVAGKGNNGGDALVIARQCYVDGMRGGTIVSVGATESLQTEICRKLGIPVYEWPDAAAREAIARAEVLVDGLTGTGLRGSLRAPLDEAAAAMNASAAYTIAIDVPSGVGDSFRPSFPAVQAELTVTMGLPKLCLYLPHARPLCGEIVIVPIGFPPALVDAEDIPGELMTLSTVRSMVPAVAATAYKNKRGTVGVFAGAIGTTGAAVLASQAAARSRAGLVTLFITPEAYPLTAPRLGGVMVRPCDFDSCEPSEADVVRFDVRLVGPGWGISASRRRWLRALFAAGAGVLDADGLNLLAEEEFDGLDLRGRWILTPHPLEFARLAKLSRDEVLDDPLPPLLYLSKTLQAVIVLKSHVTYVASPNGRYWVLDGMTPALGTGGSGDLLAGVIAGFLAGGLAPEAAACAGVLVHNRAGRRGFAELGWFAAEDLLPYISREARLDEGE